MRPAAILAASAARRADTARRVTEAAKGLLCALLWAQLGVLLWTR